MFPQVEDSHYYSVYPNNLFLHGLIVHCANFLQNSGLVDFITNFCQQNVPTIYDKIVGFTNQNPG